MQGRAVCSTLLGPSVPSSARTRCLCRSQTRVARLMGNARSRIVARAGRRDTQPSESIIDFIADEADTLPPFEDSSSDQQVVRPSSLSKQQQEEYINDYVETYLDKARVRREKDRIFTKFQLYKHFRQTKIQHQVVYPEDKDPEYTVHDDIEFPVDMWENENYEPHEPYVEHEWHPYELRAWVEKRRYYAQAGAEWDQARAGINRGTVGQVSEFNDVRLMPKDAPAKRWTHQEIWNLITEDGYNYNPSGHEGIVFKPDIKCDYFSEAIVYKDEMIDMLEKDGRIFPDEEEPDMMKEVSISASSDFADLDANSNAENEQQEGPETLDSEVEPPPGANQVESLETVAETEQENLDADEDE